MEIDQIDDSFPAGGLIGVCIGDKEAIVLTLLTFEKHSLFVLGGAGRSAFT